MTGRQMARSTIRKHLGVGFATACAVLPWTRITADERFLTTALIVVCSLTLLGCVSQLIAKSVWAPSLIPPVALIGMLFVWANRQGEPENLGFLQSVPYVFRATASHIDSEKAPMAAHDPTLLFLVTIVGLVVVLTSWVFVGLNSAVPAGLPLVIGYVTAVSVMSDPLPIVDLAAVCAGWVALLTIAAIDRDERWLNSLTSRRRWSSSVGRFAANAVQLGIFALVASLAIGIIVPHQSDTTWWSNEDQGSLQLIDPTIELNRNLRLPEDRPLITYQTTADNGVFLRNTVLTSPTPDGWAQIAMNIEAGFPLTMPGRGTTVRTEVESTGFASSYLPVPFAPTTWSVDGNWGYDPMSLTVLSTDRSGNNDQTLGLSYQVNSRPVEPTAAELAEAEAGRPQEGLVAVDLPPDVPSEIRGLAQEITANATTDGRRAVALQDWLRNPDRFTYSLEAPEGTGYEVTLNFLTETYSGYCIHFSTAMALMSRALGIPSRVAIGFSSGERQADGSWVVSAHDMHAWPELYFSGIGWVRFEPTASVSQAPDWTMLDQAPEVPQEPTPTPTPTMMPSPDPPPPVEPATPEESGSSVDLTWLLWVIGIGMAVSAPALIRMALRRSRLKTTVDERRQIKGAWDELRASAIDLGVPWHDSTPRQTVQPLMAGLDGEAAAALLRLFDAEERARYASSVPTADQWAHDVALVCAAWREKLTGWTRLWTKFAPRSLLPAPIRSKWGT